MLSTELSTIAAPLIAILALLASVFSLYRANQAAKYANSCLEFVQQANKRSVALKHIAELQAEMTDLRDVYVSLLESHKKLRSRIGMRAVRERRKEGINGSESVAGMDEAEKAAYKQQLREKLTKDGYLKR